MNACTFCRIVARELPASIVYEDDATLAFIDLRQPTAAHVLVIPKQHAEMIYDLEQDTAARVMQTVVLVARAVRRTINPPGLNLWQSNGHAGGQEVPHVHMHIIAREVGDGLVRLYPTPPRTPGTAELDALAATIRKGFAAEDTTYEASPPVDPRPYRRRMRAIVRTAQRRWAGREVSRSPANAAKALLEPAHAFLRAGDGRNALIVLDAVCGEYMTAWHDLEEWSSDDTFLLTAARACTQALLLTNLSEEERAAWRTKLAAWHEAVEDFGQDGPFAAAIAATALPDGIPNAIGYFTQPDDALMLVESLEQQSRMDEALGVAEQSLALAGEAGYLAAWLRDRAAAEGQTDLAVRAARIAFEHELDLPSYLRVKELAGDAWASHRDEMLTLVRTRTTLAPQDQAEILAFEGLTDEPSHT